MMKCAGCLTLFGKTRHAVSESDRAALKKLSGHSQRADDLYIRANLGIATAAERWRLHKGSF